MTLTSNMGTDVKPQNVVGLFPCGHSVQQRQMNISENQKALVLLPAPSGTNLIFFMLPVFHDFRERTSKSILSYN